MRNIVKAIDSVNEWVGSTFRWLVVALVVVTLYDVIARYVFHAPTVWGYEISCMLGGAIALFGWGYSQLHQSHIRVDVFYTRLSPRGKAIIDVLGTVIFFFPLFAVFIGTSVSFMWRAWLRGEVMTETFWYPPAGPFRTIVVIGGCLFFLQFVAQFIRDLHILRKGKPL